MHICLDINVKSNHEGKERRLSKDSRIAASTIHFKKKNTDILDKSK